MNKLFARLYDYFEAHKALMYIILAATTILFGVFACKVHFDENIASLLPHSKQTREMEIAFESVRIKDKVFLEITTAEGAEAVGASELAAYMDEFIDLCSAGDSAGFISNVMYRFDTDDVMNLLYYAIGALPCHAGEDFYSLLDKNLNEEFISGMSEGGASSLAGQLGSYAIVDGHLFCADSTMALAYISPAFNALDTRIGAKFTKFLGSNAAEFKKSHPEVEILYHGPVVEGVSNSGQIRKDLWLTVGISLVLIVLLMMVCFRTCRTSVQLLVPVLYGCVFALACVYWIMGSMSLIAMGIGAIVLGVAISYCLHIITHFKYVSDARTVLAEESRPVCLGCLTTIGAFAGLLFTSSDLLRDFGIFASFALVGTTLFSLIFLPHFFTARDTAKNEKAFALVNRINSYPLDRNKPFVIGLSVACLVCICMAGKVGFDSDLSHIGFREDHMVRSEKLYNEKVNGSHYNVYYAAHAADLDSAVLFSRAMCAKLDSLKKAGMIYGYTGLGPILVTQDEQVRNIAMWKEYWTPEKIDATEDLLSRMAEKYSWDTGDFDVPQTFRLMAQADYEPQDFFYSGALPESVMCNFIEEVSDGYLVFTGVLLDRQNVMAVGDEVSEMHGISVLDPFYYAGDLVKLVHKDFDVVLLISSIFVFIVLLLSFKSITLAIIAFLPMGLSWYIVQGLMAILGLEFNLINIMISTFIFGIGVDYSIFVMEGLISRARFQSYRLLLCHKSAIFFSAIILIAVVGSLLFAKHPAIHSIGLSTIIGMTSTILITYAIQPILFKLAMKLPWMTKKYLEQCEK